MSSDLSSLIVAAAASRNSQITLLRGEEEMNVDCIPQVESAARAAAGARREARGEEDDERDEGDGDSASAVNARGGWRVDFNRF